MSRSRASLFMGLVLVLLGGVACSGAGEEETSLTIYSGRNEELVGPIIDRFRAETGIEVEVRYGDSAELAAALLEEGDASPADLFFAQDPVSLGSVATAGMFDELPTTILDRVPAEFSDTAGTWVGITGRVRVVAYDTSLLSPSDLPADEDGFTDPAWSGRLGVAPTNGSFLAFVAAKIAMDGEQATLEWLQAIAANNPGTYPKNSAIIAAIDEGQVEVGLVNHYYRMRFAAEQPDTVVANHFFDTATAAGLVMPAGAGVLATADSKDAAAEFLEFLLSDDVQAQFAAETFEYPLVAGVSAHPDLPPLAGLPRPILDLSSLAGLLDRASELVAEAGLL